MQTTINLDGQDVLVTWEGAKDVLIPENKTIFDMWLIEVYPPEILNKYGQEKILELVEREEGKNG